MVPWTLVLSTAVLTVVLGGVAAGTTDRIVMGPAMDSMVLEAGGVVYRPPVDAPVVDPFRMDNGPYGAGNRGLEYGTHGGEPVWATASGEVTFVGRVADRLVLTLRHEDGRLSSLTNLASTVVVLGAVVSGGDLVGTAAPSLHLGVREDGRYIDPTSLFGALGLRGPRGVAYLVEPTLG